MIVVLGASVLPDFDFVPGLLLGEPNRFHGGWSHSLGAAVLAGLCAAWLFPRQRIRAAFWTALAWLTHCILDTLNADGSAPYGVPLLWPFSHQTFHAPFPLFGGIHHGAKGATFVQFFSSVFSAENLRNLLWEGVVGGSVAAVAAQIGKVRRA